MRKTIEEFSLKDLVQVIELKQNYQEFHVSQCLKELLKRGYSKEELKITSKEVLLEFFTQQFQERNHFTASSAPQITSQFLTTSELKRVAQSAFANYSGRLSVFNSNLPYG